MQTTKGSGDNEKRMRDAQKALRVGLSRLDRVLPAVLRKSGLERRLREHAVFSLWPAVAGEKLAARSRPVFIDTQLNLVVTASDSAVAQELSLSKMQLLQSLAPLSRAAGVEVRGIRVDLKFYHQRPEPIVDVEVLTLPDPDERALSAIELGDEQRFLVERLRVELLQKQDDPQREHINKRILITYEKQLRLDIWRNAHGFPVCEECGFAVSRLHAGVRNKVCFNCYLSTAET